MSDLKVTTISEVEVREIDNVPLQLTRMEGVLNLIAFQVTSLSDTVRKHDETIAVLSSGYQRLSEQMEADKKTAVALALALKEADTERRNKSEQSWTPFQRTLGIVVALVALASFYISYIT